MNDPHYLQQVAQALQEHRVQEHQARCQNIASEFQQAEQEAYAAYQRGDREEWKLRLLDAQQLKQEWDSLNPPQAPQPAPEMVEYLRRKQQFVERHGPAAVNALDMAHRYVTAPRNPSTNNPAYSGMGIAPNTSQYFQRMDDLLELYAKDLGLYYDRNAELPTPNEAAKISGVSNKAYNAGVKQAAAAGRLGRDK